jgi:gas vesicle protein
MFREEMGEGLDHLMRAAGHAAGGIGAAVGPRMEVAREQLAPTADRVRRRASRGWDSTASAFTPLTDAARGASRQAKAKGRKYVLRKEEPPPRKKWSVLAGLVAAGAAVGAIGALVLRRRRQEQWDEYDPNLPLESRGERTDRMADAKAKVGDVAEKAADKAKDVAHKISDTASRAADKIGVGADRTADHIATGADTAADRIGTTAEKAAAATAAQAAEVRDRTGSTDELITRTGSQSHNSRS